MDVIDHNARFPASVVIAASRHTLDLTVSRPLPVFPDERTFSESVSTSQTCTCTEIEAAAGIGADHETAARRNPHTTRTEAAIIAIPTVMKPTVTTVSCQGRAL